jgi:hypothetical protein
MNEQDTKHLLAYLQAADNRNITAADVMFWMETLPEWLDLETAKAAVRMFFTEPERNAGESVYFTTRHLIRCAKSVKHRREVEEARERAKTPAITARHRPPAGGWRARVPGGYPEAPEEPAEGGEEAAEEFTPEQLKANRERLAATLRAGRLVDPALKDGNTRGRGWQAEEYMQPGHLTEAEKAAGMDGK